jgi:hypothetical protein
VFVGIYLAAEEIYCVVTALAAGERVRIFKVVSPGMLPPLRILYLLRPLGPIGVIALVPRSMAHWRQTGPSIPLGRAVPPALDRKTAALRAAG